MFSMQVFYNQKQLKIQEKVDCTKGMIYTHSATHTGAVLLPLMMSSEFN